MGQIAAAVIGGVILLMLAVIAWRSQSHVVGAAQYAAAKGSLLSVAQVLEEDIANIGAGMTSAELASSPGAFLPPFSPTPNGHFEFYTWADRTLPNDEILVRYRWQPTGGMAWVYDPDLGTFGWDSTYVLEREVGNSGVWTPLIDTLTEISFDFGLENLTQIESPDAPTSAQLPFVRSIRVTLVAVSPLGGTSGFADDSPEARQQMRTTRWTRTFQPRNLTRASL